MKAAEHFFTITYHKLMVMDYCFSVGLIKQGLLHDLSKYSPTEFMVGARYYQGDQSPNNAERIDRGCSTAWMHHQGRNLHHFEYWIDYSATAKKGIRVPIRMPRRYLVEMFLDRIAASKVYNPKSYDDSFPLKYLMRSYNEIPMHQRTKEELKFLLKMLSEHGENYTFEYIRKKVLKNDRRRENFIQWYAVNGQPYIRKLLGCVEKLGNSFK